MKCLRCRGTSTIITPVKLPHRQPEPDDQCMAYVPCLQPGCEGGEVDREGFYRQIACVGQKRPAGGTSA